MADKLFLSFWKLALENLPVGHLVHTILNSAEAKQRIEQAQQSNSLVCVSADDLLVPEKHHRLESHRELCQLLQEHFGVFIVVEDFLNSSLVEGEEVVSIVPLELVQINNDASLMIVTCHYSLPETRSSGQLSFQAIPDSVEFHLLTID